MSIKSTWAYNNGKRMVSEAESRQKNSVPKFDFIEDREGNLAYAERRRDDRGRYYLSIKVHANRAQANRQIERLKEHGYNVRVSEKHPFKIIKL